MNTVLNAKEGFFTQSLHGVQYDDVAEFKDGISWSDPSLNFFFKHATIDAHFQNSNYNKEIFSRFLAIAIIILFLPIILAVVIGIKVTMPGKVFFTQTRVGKDGELFEIIKFRSMIENAESATGHTLSWSGDTRITKFGQFLRKSHLDELPQLLNVLKGDMYFIGPRPERPEFTKIYDVEIADYTKRHVVKPGISGLAQVACLYDATPQQKLKFDIMYIAFRDSLILNVIIGYHTSLKMFSMSPTTKILKKLEIV